MKLSHANSCTDIKISSNFVAEIIVLVNDIILATLALVKESVTQIT